MKKTKVLLMIMVVFVGAMMTISCDNSKTYAEKLSEEKDAIASFIKEQGIQAITIDEDQEAEYFKQRSFNVPENIHFELGQWYKLKNKNDMYFRIESYGDTKNMFGKVEGSDVNNNDLIIRYDSCYNLKTFDDWSSPMISNWNVNNWFWNIPSWNYSTPSEFGIGIDFPIPYIGDNGIVQLIVPSKCTPYTEQANVIPYFYKKVKYKISNFSTQE